MAQLEMYPPIINSPTTQLANAIDSTTTSIEVVDGARLPDAPNICTIGRGENPETILYTSKVGNVISGITRGFQGNAQNWQAGTQVARLFTAYDLESLQQNHKTHLAEKASQAALGHVKVDGTTIIADENGVISGLIPSTIANQTIYVATTGSDITGDGTSGNPFATIKKALSTLPINIKHTVTISVAAGTFNETGIEIKNFIGSGDIIITGAGIDSTIIQTSTGTGAILQAARVPIRVVVKNLSFEYTGNAVDDYKTGIVFYNVNVYIKAVKFINMGKTASNYGIGTLTFLEGCSAKVIDCIFDSCVDQIVVGWIGSQTEREYSMPSDVVSINNSSINMQAGYGLVAVSGTIRKSGTQPTGNTGDEYIAEGGQII